MFLAGFTCYVIWRGRIREFTLKMLGRDLTADEVRIMVNEYINDNAGQSDDGERWLNDAARRSLSGQEAAEVDRKLRKFAKDFAFHVD